MTYICALLFYTAVYNMLYAIPFFVASWIPAVWPVDVPEPVAKLMGLALVVFWLLGVYRAHLAADVYEKDTGLWEAHRISGVLLRVNLRFLPVVRHLFDNEESPGR